MSGPKSQTNTTQSSLESKVLGAANWFFNRALSWTVQSLKRPETRRLIVVGAFMAGFCYLSEYVQADVQKMKKFEVPLTELKVSPPPGFLSKQAAIDVQGLALPEGGKGFSVFDDRLVPTMAYVLEGLPWVDKVEFMRLEYPGKIRFGLSVLEPTALVKSISGGTVVVAKDGRRFPRDYLKGLDVEGSPTLPLIIGLDMRQGGKDVLLSALTFVERLREQKLLKKANIKVIDVSNHKGTKDPKQSEILLINEQGTVIEWGRLEDGRRVHLSFATKSMKLQRFLQKGPEMAEVKSVALRWHETVYLSRENENNVASRK
ncbi:MAG: hypothetical protein P1V97_14330 [Planctomycetota bacterium]|nr:hypothetical protein [Planctomycetota bacterium]